MGSNMQRQAVPLLRPQTPLVGTGMELRAALDSGHVLVSDVDGEVIAAQGDRIVVANEQGEHTFFLRKFERSNQSTNIDQRPVVHKGDFVASGDVLADSASTDHGRLALGQNVVCAFMSWEGANYEDAIIISEELVRNDQFTSVHIEKHETRSRETKLGPEEVTHDIPNVGEDALRDLDEFGVIRVGAEVGPNDILVGKITPKGEKELTPEEKLLRAIFGDKAREVKDSSLRLPHGEHGRVVDVKIFDR
jgi:DNA-directed RNA polymerase subunit beta